MAALENLVVQLALDASDYDKNMEGARSKLDGFASGAQKVGGVMTAAVTAPIVAIGVASIGMASDLNETMSKVDTLFGTSSAAVVAWSEDSAASFGLSQAAALDSVGTIGNMFMQLGASSDAAAKTGQGMVGLAADIASFHNVAGGSEEVLEAMNAAFRGEYDSLQRYIPTINAAAVEQAALAATGKTAAKELTALEKATAVQALVMAGAGAAVGDFAKTSDGLANSQRIMQAELANVSAEIGKELLPIALELVKGLQSLLGWFTELSPETKKWVVIIAGVAAAAGPVIGTIGMIAGGISGLIGLFGAASAALPVLGAALAVLTGPIGLIVAAVALLSAAWISDFGGIQTKTKEFGTWLTTSWPGWMGNLKEGWQGFSSWWQSDSTTQLAAVKSGWNTFTTWLDDHTGNHWDTIKGVAETGMEAQKGVITAGLQFITGDWQGGLETLRTTAETAWAKIYEMFGTQIEAVKGFFVDTDWGALGLGIINGIVDGMNAGAQFIIDAATGAAQTALDAAKSFLGISSPSKVAADAIGEPFAEGVGVGAMRGLRALTGQIDAGLAGVMGGMGTGTTNSRNVTIEAGAIAIHGVATTPDLLAAIEEALVTILERDE